MFEILFLLYRKLVQKIFSVSWVTVKMLSIHDLRRRNAFSALLVSWTKRNLSREEIRKSKGDDREKRKEQNIKILLVIRYKKNVKTLHRLRRQ